MKVALVHELLTMRGGAEKVLRILAKMFPDAPIYTLLYDEKKLGDWFPKERVRTSNLQNNIRGLNHHLYLKKFPAAVEAWDFREFDLVISSSSAFVHGILTNGAPKHICYVHSPARYLWDRTHDVLNRAGTGIFGPLRRRYLSKAFHHLRIWDSEAADRPDLLFAASNTVERRIEAYWRRESEVLYPPIDDEWLSLGKAKNSAARSSDAPYLVISTLVPYKRIELAIEACNMLKKKLIVIGDGPAKKELERLAGPTIEFRGYLDAHLVADAYANARAVIFPGDEDFGLVPLESLSCGTPVIAYRGGGALETLTEEIAEFFDEPTAESLTKAIDRFEKRTFDPARCYVQAARFSRVQFEDGIRRAVHQLVPEREA